MAHLEASYCPECGMPAWVEWRGGRTGPADLELVKVRCFARHWFLMPAGQLDAYTDMLTAEPTVRRPV